MEYRTKILLILLSISWLCLVLPADCAVAQTATVQGIITDHSDSQPLEGANITLQNQSDKQVRGMAADDNGFYQITNLQPGSWFLQISFVGYLAYKDTLNVGAGEIYTVSVSLEPGEERLDELIVSPTGGAARLEAGRQRITPTEIQRIPTPAGTGDLASYIQTLPGVVALGDRGGQFYIRGGTPSQNMVLVDGTMIFKPFHMLGFFSVFPSELVSEVDFYAGGFSPRYSGRLSSVLDVKMRDGDRHQAGVSATFSPFVGEVLVEGPLKKDRASVITSFRRSLIETTSPWFLSENQPVHFESQYIKASHFGTRDTRCSSMLLRTYDRGQLDFEIGEVFKWTNFLFGGRCVILPPGSNLLFDINAGLTHVSNEVGSGNDSNRFSKVTRFNIDVNLTRYIRQTRFNYGLLVLIKSLNYEINDRFFIPQSDREHLFSGGGYLEIIIPIGEQFRVYPGMVLTLYREYKPSLEPRLRFSWQPPIGDAGDSELNITFGRYLQSLVGVSDTRDASSAFTAWMAEPFGGSRMEAWHALSGWRQALSNRVNLSVEGYYKWLRDIPVTVWSTLAEFTTDLALADGQVYGADVRLEYNHRPVYGFVGYGYSFTEYESAQDHFSMWFGEPVQRYHPPHDRRHQLNGLMSFYFGKFTTSLRWELGTGLPFTRPIGFDEIFFYNERLPNLRREFGTSRVILEKPYQGRTPAYHRLDISLAREFIFSSVRMALQVGAINLYDHTNLFYYDVFTHRRINQLPFAPYFSLKLETQ